MTDREKLALWMIAHGFATGHGDTLEDLLEELGWQVAELRQRRGVRGRAAQSAGGGQMSEKNVFPVTIERDWKAEKKDLEEAFDLIQNRLIRAEQTLVDCESFVGACRFSGEGGLEQLKLDASKLYKQIRDTLGPNRIR